MVGAISNCVYFIFLLHSVPRSRTISYRTRYSETVKCLGVILGRVSAEQLAEWFLNMAACWSGKKVFRISLVSDHRDFCFPTDTFLSDTPGHLYAL
jgi:hypothetical protein